MGRYRGIGRTGADTKVLGGQGQIQWYGEHRGKCKGIGRAVADTEVLEGKGQIQRYWDDRSR